MEFEIGSWVMYSATGICRILSREKKNASMEYMKRNIISWSLCGRVHIQYTIYLSSLRLPSCDP